MTDSDQSHSQKKKKKEKRKKISGQNENISAQRICRGLIEFMINFTDFTPGGDISGIIKPPLSVAFFYSRPKKLLKPPQTYRRTPEYK